MLLTVRGFSWNICLLNVSLTLLGASVLGTDQAPTIPLFVTNHVSMSLAQKKFRGAYYFEPC